MAANAVMGGTIGAIMGPLSSVGGSAVTGAVRGLISGGVRNAVSMGSTAAASTFKSFGSTQVGGLVGKAMAGRAASSGGREAVESVGATARSPIRVASGESCPNSFAPATAVLMADGTTKKIEDVRVGDLVLATDPITGKTEKRRVTALIVGVGEKQMVEITIDTDGDKGDKTGTIAATAGHPFWAPDLKKWVTAEEVAAGSMLKAGAGTRVQVTAVKKWTAKTQRVHNLSVDGIHTYFVVAGTAPVLVHNCVNRTNFMDPNDQFAINHLSAKPLPGFHDVVAHGSPASAQVRGTSVNHRVLANLIKRDPNYGGGPIRLCSCSTGKLDDGFARNLANKLGVDVMAPVDLLWAFPSGAMAVGPSRFSLSFSTGWRTFSPGNKITN
jgi:hypothetical protein